MNFFNRLTTVGKGCVIALVVAIIGSVLYFSGATKALGGLGNSGDADVKIAINTFNGFSPLSWANAGLEPNENCAFYEKYGLKVKIVVMDDFDACRAALKNGDVDMAYCTNDVLPIEMGASSDMSDMRYFMLLNFSNGADAIVADASINTIADLKGKKVAYAEGTASHTLLLNALETSGLSMSDIVPVKVASGIEAAQAFKSKAVQACVTWAPDDQDCVAAVKGSKVLTSTAQANSLVSDGLIAKKSYLDSHKELAAKVVEAILWANSEVKYNKEAFNAAAKQFAESFESDVDFALASASTINYATLADELNWFGLDASYSGMTSERIYTKMARVYTDLGLAKNVMPWSKVAYTDIIEMVAANNKLDNTQTATGTKSKAFTAPTEQLETATAISNKKVTINFPTAGFTLDNEARCTIDREFVDIAQEYSNSRIRVEGNTDNTGNYDSNVALSKKRAQAVVDYLVSEYKMDRNRFVVVGNGPKHAVADNVAGANANYRTTDFQLLAE